MAGKRLALIVINSTYKDLAIVTGQNPIIKSAIELAKVLEDPAIGSYEVTALLDESSTKINEQINILFNNRDQDDLLLLYFSGIGMVDENNEGYIATINSRPNQLSTTAISISNIRTAMEKSLSEQQVLIMDVSYAGFLKEGER